MAACRPLHTRRAADSENDDTDDARHHDGAKFFNPWVDPTEFSDSKVFAVAKFMCDSATKQVSDCATQQVKTRAMRVFRIALTRRARPGEATREGRAGSPLSARAH